MIHLQESIPYKPGERVYFLHDNSIRRGFVHSVTVKLLLDGREEATWDIWSNDAHYHVDWKNVKTSFECIRQEAHKKLSTFKEGYEYKQIEEIF